MEENSRQTLAEFIEGPDDLHLKGHSISMLPSIWPGEMIKICKSREPRSGDVVIFRSGGVFVVHRLVRKQGFVAVTKGDNNTYCDAPISVFDIVGVIEGKSSRWALGYYFVRNRLRACTPRPVRQLLSAMKHRLSSRKDLSEHRP